MLTMKWRSSLLFFILLITSSSQLSYGVRIYPFKMDPKEHPDYERYAVSHPSLDEFDPLPQFTTLRDILSAPNQHLVNYTELINSFCLDPNTTLGHVIWPGRPDFMFADNYKEFINFIFYPRKRAVCYQRAWFSSNSGRLSPSEGGA